MQIAVLNQSTLVSSAQAQEMTSAVASQLWWHACPAWHRRNFNVFYRTDPSQVSPNDSLLTIFDDADQAGALGWHDESPQGMPYGRIFARPVLDNGGQVLTSSLSVASVLSHEALELTVDPMIDFWAQEPSGDLIAIEVGDPVESDSYSISTPGVNCTVSNFVLPHWFDDSPPPNAKFDYMGNVNFSFTMSKGGYFVKMAGGTVTQVFARDYPEWRKETKKHVASRTAKRLKRFNDVHEEVVDV